MLLQCTNNALLAGCSPAHMEFFEHFIGGEYVLPKVVCLSNNLCFIDRLLCVRLALTNLCTFACGQLPASSSCSSFALPSLESWQWLKIRHIQVELLIVTNENFTLHWLPRPSDYLLLVILVHWHSWVMCVPIGSLTQNCHCKGIVKRARQSPTSVKPWQHCSSGHNPT